MASAITDFGAAYWLQILFNLQPIPATLWVALVEGEPGTATDGDIIGDSEPADPAYARVAVATGNATWGTNGGYLTNLGDVDFGVADADWGTPDHYALCTSASGGDVFAYGELANPQLIAADDAVTLPAGGIVLALVNSDAPIAI